MSENAYGFSHALTLGNMSDIRGLEENRRIRQSNINNLTKHQNNIKNAVDSFNTNDLKDLGFKKIQEVVGDQLLTKGKAVEDVLTGAQKTLGAIKTGGGMLFNKIERVVPSAVESSETVVGTSEAAHLARAGAGIGEVVAPEVKAVLGGAKVLGGALQVGLAVDDFVTDIKSGSISGSNVISKVGNITEQVAGGTEAVALLGAAGGLEAAGLAADASIFGAPVGIALNVAGGVLGLLAAGEDLIGDKEESNTLAENEATAKAAPIPQQAQIPIVGKALGTTGAEVKNNIQEGK